MSPFGPRRRRAVSWDEPALERAVAGDARAQARLVRAHQDAVYGLLYRLASPEEALAADLTQETFVKALGALPRFHGGAEAVKPWLLKIAHRTFLDHARKKQTASLDALQEEQGFDPPAPTPAGEALDLDAVGAAMAALPPTWRQAIWLRHVEDAPYEAIAEHLAVPLGTVKTWIHRGRAAMRAALLTETEVSP